MSPVGRAAPRSAAAIAGQAAGGGRGRPRGARAEPGMGARVRGRGKLGSWGRVGRSARREEWRAEGRGAAGGGGAVGKGEGSEESLAEVGENPEGPLGWEGQELWGKGAVYRRKAEGRKGASGAEREKGGKGGRARAEDGEGGGAGRNLEVCAGRGSSPGGEGVQHAGLTGAE